MEQDRDHPPGGERAVVVTLRARLDLFEQFDGFFELGLGIWDIAAGAALVIEAGGRVTDWSGEDAWVESGNILAAHVRTVVRGRRRVEACEPRPSSR